MVNPNQKKPNRICLYQITVVFLVCNTLVAETPILYEQTQISAPSKYTIFGAFIAMDNGTLAVTDQGVPGENSVYIYTRIQTAWKRQSKLTAPDYSLSFGHSMVLSGDTLAVSSGNPVGIYIFVRHQNQWQLQSKIPQPQELNLTMGFTDFGQHMALYRDTLVVGDPWAFKNEEGEGAVYIYGRKNGAWSMEKILYPSERLIPYQRYGTSVSIYGDSIAVGAPACTETAPYQFYPGKIYIFTRKADQNTASWIQEAILTSGDAECEGFGSRVALFENDLVAGSPDDNPSVITVQGKKDRTVTGSAYVFQRTNGNWQKIAKLLPSDGEFEDRFGTLVSITKNQIVISAPSDNFPVNTSPGRAYLYQRQNGRWKEALQMRCSRCSAGFSFRDSMAFDGRFFVGSNIHYRDRVYVFSIPEITGSIYGR
jgi:hypothetical protein